MRSPRAAPASPSPTRTRSSRLPSHTSLLTGTYPYEHGVRDNNGYRVKADSATLAARLKRLGFATGAFVGGFPLDQRFGLNAGFDAYDDRIGETGSTVDFALPERRADVVVSSALAWTGAQPGKWFAWVHVFDPHAPYAAARRVRPALPDGPVRRRGRVDRLRARRRSSIGSPRCRARRSSSSPRITARASATTAS